MRKLLTLTLLAACAAQGADIVALRCSQLIDARGGRAIPNAVVLVEGGRIVKAGPSSQDTVPAGARVVDLSGGTCLPGLIDVHDHLTSDPTRSSGYKSLGVSVPRAALTGVHNARLTLEAGFTSVRNVGAAGYADVALRDAINEGDVPGPA